MTDIRVAQAQSVDDEIVDVTIAKLALSLARGARPGQERPLDDQIIDGEMQTSMDEGAPGMTVTIEDKDLVLLNSGLFAYKLDAALDGVPHRLVNIELQDSSTENILLTFEHRVVAWLREHNTYLKASRGHSTRAEFIYKMVREVEKGPITFISPDLHKREAIAKAKQAPKKKQKDAVRAPGFADNAPVKVKGNAATLAQKRQIDRALTVADSLGANTLATIALLCAGTGESDFLPAPPNRLGYRGVFQWKFDQYDTEAQAHYFLKGGKGFQAGGAMALAKANPDMDPGEIATRVEASGEPGNFYGRYQAEARATLTLWNGGHMVSTDSGGAQDEAYYKAYEFTRGTPNKPEDSWIAIRRLADEVRWRAFVSGRRSLYYVSDQTLLRSRPRYLIDPQTLGVQSLRIKSEVGGRTIVIKGKRLPKPSEATLMVRMDRWDAPPGSVIELADYGIANGRWLVSSARRGFFDSLGTVELRQEQRTLAEPRPQKATRTGSTSSTSTTAALGPRGTPGQRGPVKIASFANRPGVRMHKEILAFLALVAGQTREHITVNTGTKHNQYALGTHNQSDHWTGDAADLDIGGDARRDGRAGARGDNIATAALVVLGVPRTQARQMAIRAQLDFSQSWTWKGCRVQVGWRTMVGGDHFNHVHIGVHPPAKLGRSTLDEISRIAATVAGN